VAPAVAKIRVFFQRISPKDDMPHVRLPQATSSWVRGQPVGRGGHDEHPRKGLTLSAF